ncbi:MAG: glycoside hydrolase family 99-like domain-containing protein [Chitinophagaceae bacterium]|nr:glycoside hydrolase family 99-like domain-containing protein [Chitinophagaceae bacterium]
MKRAWFLLSALVLPFFMVAQNSDITLGAYYFDGWSSLNSHHLTDKLRDSFPDRKPKWGWVTSTPQAMKEQIDLAADAGLAFFSFDWYYPDYDKKNFRQDPLNHALSLYLAATNKSRLKFCLLVANHAGQEIGPDDWPAVTDEWVSLMKDPDYLKVSGKPYLAFFDLRSLVRLFGSDDALHKALDELRNKAGQPGATIAVCVSPNARAIQEARDCGFDMITGYNYPDPAYKDFKKEHHVDSLAHFGNWVWNQFRNAALPYIPVATLNWDPRPWANGTNFYSKSVRYTGFDSSTVYRSIQAVRNWISRNPSCTPPERIALLYAWNEYGEGAWLTPSENDHLHLLSGVKKALSEP